MSVKGHSVKFEVGNNATVDASTTWIEFAAITEITPPSVTADDIEVSHMQTPEQFKDFDPGWAESSEVELQIQYDKEQNETVYGLFRLKRGYRMTFVDGAKWLFVGFISEFGNEVDREGIITANVKVKVTGKPEFQKAPPAP